MTKEKNKKPYIGGKKITRRQALRGLGDPKTWPAFKREMEEEFKRKPLLPAKSGM